MLDDLRKVLAVGRDLAWQDGANCKGAGKRIKDNGTGHKRAVYRAKIGIVFISSKRLES